MYARRLSALIALAMFSACRVEKDAEGPDARGAGLAVASITPDQRARAYTAALHQAFDFGPSLVLLLDTARLPKNRRGPSPGALSDSTVRALRQAGTIRGLCSPPANGPAAGAKAEVPLCSAVAAGYVIRLSDIFQMPGDTVQLYVLAERYRTPGDSARFVGKLSFEQRSDLVKRGDDWRVARTSRLAKQ